MPMTKNVERAEARFGGKNEAIDRWLGSRKEVLVRFLALTKSRDNPSALPSRTDIGAFFDTLVDYVSAGHFEIYEELLEQAEHAGTEAMELAKELFPQFSVSTDTVLAFTDRYSEASDEYMVAHFDPDLAKLGADLTERFELEDKLIGALFLAESETA